MTDDGYYGHQGIFDDTSEFNVRDFHVRQVQGKLRTSIPVKIIAVHGGGLGPAPTVDVQPMVKQIDGQGNSSSHSVIYGVPVTRNQGGTNAVINDPQVGDIGHMVVADRDISALKANAGAESNPGSFRMHNEADGVYQAAMLNKATPTQYVQFTTDGLVIADKNGNKVVMKPGKIEVIPAAGGMVFLGGDPDKGGTFGFVQTDAGLSMNVKARVE